MKQQIENIAQCEDSESLEVLVALIVEDLEDALRSFKSASEGLRYNPSKTDLEKARKRQHHADEAAHTGGEDTDEQVREIISRSVITASSVTVPPGQLAPKLYQRVNKVLANAGGQWDRKAKAHLFERDPRLALSKFLETGKSVNQQQMRQSFYTPPEVAEYVVRLSKVGGERVLEPSAGEGALVKECLRQGAASVCAVEFDEFCEPALYNMLPVGHVHICDFLEFRVGEGREYFRIVMNPPFTKGAWKKHLTHALSMLAYGGILACVVPDVTDQITAVLEPKGVDYTVFPLPKGSFKSSGTMINTAVVVVENYGNDTSHD